MGIIFRLFSYLYHLVLCLFLLAISGVALMSHGQLKLDMLPWKGDMLLHWVFFGSIVGILAIILAMTGVFRFLFPLWTLLVFVLMVRGFLLTPYTFQGKDSFYQTLWIIGGAFIAFLASLTLLRKPRRR
jgi:hypothetical protein